jgi:O-Antigen ligase
MSMDMGTGMIRMQTSIDILTPFLIFYVLKAQTLGIALNARFRSAYLLISAFAIFLSFSRVLMAEGLASLLLFWFTLKPAQMVRSMLFFSVIACALVAAIGPSTIATMAGQRFLSDVNQGSDDTRVEQIEALVKEHQSYPFFGKGLGGYSSDLVRDEKLRHSYEVQWIAFLMQFGLLGLVMIGSALGSIGWLYLQKRPSRLQLAFLALFCCWILAGFTNPYLISLTSGLVYALFLLTGLQLREKTE